MIYIKSIKYLQFITLLRSYSFANIAVLFVFDKTSHQYHRIHGVEIHIIDKEV
jgi:hypothetical protein